MRLSVAQLSPVPARFSQFFAARLSPKRCWPVSRRFRLSGLPCITNGAHVSTCWLCHVCQSTLKFDKNFSNATCIDLVSFVRLGPIRSGVINELICDTQTQTRTHVRTSHNLLNSFDFFFWIKAPPDYSELSRAMKCRMGGGGYR